MHGKMEGWLHEADANHHSDEDDDNDGTDDNDDDSDDNDDDGRACGYDKSTCVYLARYSCNLSDDYHHNVATMFSAAGKFVKFLKTDKFNVCPVGRAA